MNKVDLIFFFYLIYGFKIINGLKRVGGREENRCNGVAIIMCITRLSNFAHIFLPSLQLLEQAWGPPLAERRSGLFVYCRSRRSTTRRKTEQKVGLHSPKKQCISNTMLTFLTLSLKGANRLLAIANTSKVKLLHYLTSWGSIVGLLLLFFLDQNVTVFAEGSFGNLVYPLKNKIHHSLSSNGFNFIGFVHKLRFLSHQSSQL